MTEWQPIDTVPRDGTPVLAIAAEGNLASFRGKQAVCIFGSEFYTQEGNPQHIMCFFKDEEWYRPQHDFWISCTHWMPLPEPPTTI